MANVTFASVFDKEFVAPANAKSVNVEVTTKFAAKADLVIDPQHAEGLNISATKYLWEKGLALIPQQILEAEEIVVYGQKIDVDTLATMLFLRELLSGKALPIEWDERVTYINEVDTSDKGGYTALPLSSEVLAPSEYSIMANFAEKSTLTIEQKLERVELWLSGASAVEAAGKKFHENVVALRAEIRDHLATGKTAVEIKDGICIVHSTLRGATGIAYKFSPMILANGGSFGWTVAAFCDGIFDWKKLASMLNEIEPSSETWGGPPNCVRSPKGGTQLENPQETILECLQECLLDGFQKAVEANADEVKTNLAFLAELRG